MDNGEREEAMTGGKWHEASPSGPRKQVECHVSVSHEA